MKYRLGDICTITKGATGIMKAVPGPFPMVTLAEERKQHNEYQFDAAAVIVPLISSTGHGHASIKRIHYQEGKFALGTILCAVIPKDAALLDARYLFVYLQQFKDSVLVPLMKGAANVSLPLNKLAALEIEVPTLAKQQEVIDLAAVLTGHKDTLETLLDAQQTDTAKLRQALLREAMQGRLLPQDPTDEPAAALLQQLQAAQAKPGKPGKRPAAPLFAEAVEGPHHLPIGWMWCCLSDLADVITKGSSPTWQGIQYVDKSAEGILFITSKNVGSYKLLLDKLDYVERRFNEIEPRSILKKGDLLTNIVGASIGRTAIYDLDEVANINQAVCLIRVGSELISKEYLLHYFNSDFALALIAESQFAPGRANLSMSNIAQFPVPLPPLAEQRRIVAKLTQLLGHCEALEQRIAESRRLAGQLLQTALREALAGPAA